MATSNNVRARCKHCGHELQVDFKGPCPECGGVDKEIIATVGTAIEIDEAISVSWTKTRIYFEKNKPLLTITIILIIASPFVGLFLGGFPGVMIGLALGAICLGVGVYAVTKVRDIERGGR